MTKYKPSELSKMFGLHSNTIRLYEKIGFITKAERNANGYREFSDVHILQINLCRCIFNHPFMNRQIRAAGNKVIEAAANREIDRCSLYTEQYISAIQKEIETAQKTALILKRWADTEATSETGILYNRRQAAELFGTTTETIRNWERNGLILSNKLGSMSERLFDETDIERLRIIYMLRLAGYSMSAIHRSLSMYDEGYKNRVLSALNLPENGEDLLSVGDRWLNALYNLEHDAMQIPSILKQMEII
ncbi:MerR family transcriptional regulator [Oscillospiraceae bacterium PP1C4]